MASPPRNPREGEQGSSEFSEETSRERPTAPQKTFIAPPASQLPTKLQYVTRRASGPSGIKNVYPTVKTARRVPTLPGKPKEATTSSTGSERPGPEPAAPGRSARRDRHKRHVCTTCEKRFSSPGKLSQHVLSHTGRRDFLCPYCPQKFGRKDHLVRHVKNAHPEKSWRSAAVGTSKDPPPEASTFEESFPEIPVEGLEFKIWNPTSPKASTSDASTVRTRVPSSDIIVEIPPDLDIKVEPLEIKQEQETSPSYEPYAPEYDVYVIPSTYPPTPSNLPYISQPLTDPEQLLDPSSVQSIYLDPGEGPSVLPGEMLLLEESEPSYGAEEGRLHRLPAFTQAFQTTQSQKPPPPPPPPH
ncbi:unnamed protein product, partial [Iphiclides podalirius]